MSHRNNRREFIKQSTLAGVGVWVAGSASAAPVATSPNERIRFACIGVGGKGESDSADAVASGDVVAICDVDDKTLDKFANKFPKAKRYNDFRKLLDAEHKNIDAVTVSTPDHCHAAAAAAAMRLGKACFTQKPLTRSIYEARKLAEIAKEMNVATQMGNQGTASPSLRRAAALARGGAVGVVSDVHVWTNRPIWPQGGDRPAAKEPPSNLHWDLWIGPAPMRPYGDGYHPFAWRGWWDFGTGALGDMACHTLNMPYMGLDLKDPTAIEAETSGHNKDSYPKWSIIRYDFPATEKRPAVKLTWYDGGKRPPAELLDGAKLESSGVLIVGDKGKLYAPGDYSEKGITLLGGASEVPVDPPKSPGHFQEWVRAIKGGPEAMSNFPGYACGLTETVVLGNLAVWTGSRVEWNAKEMKATNAPELEAIIKPKFREGYSL